MGRTEQPSKTGLVGSQGTDDEEGFMEEVAFRPDNSLEE